ncbi:MAG: NAD(P)-dependent oxidoreductase [Patescibacteria group bacterium]
MKILYFYNEDWEAGYAKEHLEVGEEIVFLKGSIVDYPDFRDDGAEILSVFVNSPVRKTELDRFPNLKHVVARSTGIDHIDIEEARRRGISVSYIPAYGQNTVAEFAFMLLLALSRKLLDCTKRVRDEGLFSQIDKLRGFDLNGKTIGIAGTGRIGEYMIRQAKGFGMNVIAFDAYPRKELAQELGFSYVTLEDLLKQSDVVSLHLPYMKETHHILNMENIMTMKKGSILINTARGGLIETKALARALHEGVLGGVGLDVLEDEVYVNDETKLFLTPNPSDESMRTVLENNYIIDHPRAIVTPHNAFNTDEAIKRILDTTIENINAFQNGNPINLVK